jgi:hypothetical protein
MVNYDVVNAQISYYEEKRQQEIDLRQKFIDKYTNLVDSNSVEQFYTNSTFRFIVDHGDAEISRLTRILGQLYNYLINQN